MAFIASDRMLSAITPSSTAVNPKKAARNSGTNNSTILARRLLMYVLSPV